MVEPVSLTLGAVVTALVVKAAEKAGEETASAGASGLGRIIGWLRDRFSGAGDAAAGSALERVVEVPDSPSRAAFLAALLDERSLQDPEFRAALDRLVAEADAEGVAVTSVSQTATGTQIAQVAEVTGSSVTVTIGSAAPPAPPAGTVAPA